MHQQKLGLVYIASCGRSGSTILEMLLNGHASFWTVGEFHVLPWELKTMKKPCGCGLPVNRCTFWQPIISEHETTLRTGSISRFRTHYNTDRAVRPAEIPSLLRGTLDSSKWRSDEVQRYAMDNHTVLNSVFHRVKSEYRPGVKWLIDSSKSPYRLLWLAASGLFDVRVIHLVKDPRAFAYSIAKDTNGLNRVYRMCRAALRWRLENYLHDTIRRKYISDTCAIQLRYESLATDPDATMTRVAQWLDVPAPEASLQLNVGNNHGISGNPSRFDAGRIALDTKWASAVSQSLNRICWRLTAGPAMRYGYHI